MKYFAKQTKAKLSGSKGYTEIKMATGKKDGEGASGGKQDQDKTKFVKKASEKNASKLDSSV